MLTQDEQGQEFNNILNKFLEDMENDIDYTEDDPFESTIYSQELKKRTRVLLYIKILPELGPKLIVLLPEIHETRQKMPN